MLPAENEPGGFVGQTKDIIEKKVKVLAYGANLGRHLGRGIARGGWSLTSQNRGELRIRRGTIIGRTRQLNKFNEEGFDNDPPGFLSQVGLCVQKG